VTMVSVPFLS